ncbi:MAG: PHP domain-containing protein [Candidatus Sumerlaeia bacterium]|nr:PHP domain-containing protein [Candidatus Sumerlaeia bacterium]
MKAGKPRTYLGALHIHVDGEAGESTLDDIVLKARDSGLDFIVLTDRSTTDSPLELITGWRQGILVISGEEIETPEGHLLAFETRDPVGPRDSLEEAVRAVKDQSGTVVSIHHRLQGLPLSEKGKSLTTVPLSQAGLLEIWSFMDEFLTNVSPKGFFSSLKKPDRLLHGPSREQLTAWDKVLQERMLPIVSGLNLHHRKYPLLEWKEIIPPKLALDTLCTCVQTGELPTVAIRARDLVWNALREGHSYVVNRSVGPASGFSFHYESPDGRDRQMGESVTYIPGGRLWISLAREGEIVLRHNGLPLFWGTGKEIHFPATGPGVYRVEVRQDRRLWILSNPIRLVDDDGIIQPTVSDVT